MSQKTLRKKKRRSPERRTPCTARPRVAARPHPAPPPSLRPRAATPACHSAWSSPCTWGNPRAGEECRGDGSPSLTAPWETASAAGMAPGGKTRPLRGIRTKAEKETKPAITSDGRALDPGLPSRPPSSPSPPQDPAECSWLRLANWLCQSCVNQVGCCPGVRSVHSGGCSG